MPSRCAIGRLFSRRRTEDAGDRSAEPMQRLDVDGTDESGADDGRTELRHEEEPFAFPGGESFLLFFEGRFR
jgi:hypothetical protein